MAIAHSKLSAQGRISVPAEVRRKLGLAPGSVLEWQREGAHYIVRSATPRALTHNNTLHY